MIEMSAGMMIEKTIAKWPINYLSKGALQQADGVCSRGHTTPKNMKCVNFRLQNGFLMASH